MRIPSMTAGSRGPRVIPFVVEGFSAGMMPGNFKEQLSGQQLADLVAFLMTR